MKRQLYGAIASSQDPEEVANKIKGTILAASSILIYLAAQLFHMTLSADDIVQLATELGTLAGAVWAIYGVILHLITWLGTKGWIQT